MKQMVISLLFLIFLSACGNVEVPTASPMPPVAQSPSPTQAPVIATQRPLAPESATRTSVQVTGLRSDVKDGTTSTTASITTEGLGVGQIEISSPQKMLLTDSTTIRLKLSPAQQLAAITPVAVPVKTPGSPSMAWNVAGNIQLYQAMYAELRAVKFDINPTGPQRRNIDSPNNSVEWNWIVSPKSVGSQDLAIEISFLALVNGTTSQLNTLQNVSVSIQVQAPAPPTPTTVPINQRIADSVINNAGAIVVALIGLAGTLIGLLLKMRSDQGKEDAGKKPKK